MSGGVQNITSLIHAWSAKDNFFADQHFLEHIVWPLVKHDQVRFDHSNRLFKYIIFRHHPCSDIKI
jgi:hypothetical protein